MRLCLIEPYYTGSHRAWADGYRAYSRRFLETLDLTTTGFELEVEVIVQAMLQGTRIGWVDIRTIYGIDKVSYFHPVKDSARFLKMVWRAWRQRNSMLDT